MANPPNLLIQMVYETAKSSEIGTLGECLLNKAEEISQELDANIEVLGDFEQKINELKLHEDSSNLIWMDYSSWNHISPDFKKYVEKNLNPVLWTGVFFRYDEFLQHEIELVNSIDVEGFLALLGDYNRNYLLVWISSFTIAYERLTITQLEEININFKRKLIKSYGKTREDKIISKIYQENLGNGYRSKEFPTVRYF